MVFCPVGGDYLEENVACLKTDGKLVARPHGRHGRPN